MNYRIIAKVVIVGEETVTFERCDPFSEKSQESKFVTLSRESLPYKSKEGEFVALTVESSQEGIRVIDLQKAPRVRVKVLYVGPLSFGIAIPNHGLFVYDMNQLRESRFASLRENKEEDTFDAILNTIDGAAGQILFLERPQS